jgi:hypothetical protein
LGGAIVGISIANLVNRRVVREAYGKPYAMLASRYPALSQTALFVVTFEIAVLFYDAINVLKLIVKDLLK